tara:strand:- start:8 stop:790 length:783 start_codon:yes stop_codon:yes gene_type:complete
VKLVDSHCHLDFPDFEGQLDDVITRASNAGVKFMVTICTELSKFDQVLNVANSYENIWCTAGVHPHNAAAESRISSRTLLSKAKNRKVIAFGETGLDFHYNLSPRKQQIALFRQHIEAAREAGLPLVIHSRDADEVLVRVLENEYRTGAFTGVIHCFSGSSKLAEAVLKLGLYISVSGIVTFKNAQDLRNIIKTIPMDRLLVETDAPYLAPVPHRGKRNEPAFTALTASKVAELKDVNLDILASSTTRNFFRLFTKATGV